MKSRTTPNPLTAVKKFPKRKSLYFTIILPALKKNIRLIYNGEI